MSPVGSPGMSRIFAGSQKSSTPRTPSGPRLAAQAAGPSTRPDEAGVTFPRCDTLPGITSSRRCHSYLSRHSSFLSFTSSFSFCHQSGKEFASLLVHSPGIRIEWEGYPASSWPLLSSVLFLPTEWQRYRPFSCPLPRNHDRVGKRSGFFVSTPFISPCSRQPSGKELASLQASGAARRAFHRAPRSCVPKQASLVMRACGAVNACIRIPFYI